MIWQKWQVASVAVGKCVILLLGCLAVVSLVSAQPVPMRGLPLVDQAGRAVQGTSLVLLNFVFTNCSSTCPTQTHELVVLYEELAADVRSKVRFISVSVDPLRDTPASLRAYAKRMGANLPSWQFVTGDPIVVRQLLDRMQALGPPADQRRVEEHVTSLYLFGTDGNLVQRYRGVPIDRQRLRDEISRLVRSPRVVRP